jgi:hypothetical protein
MQIVVRLAQKSLYNRTMETTTVQIEIQLKNRTMYTRFLVTTAYGWGFGDSIVEAKKKCRSEAPKYERSRLVYRAKLVTKETTCDGAGGINYYPEFPPIELGEV